MHSIQQTWSVTQHPLGEVCEWPRSRSTPGSGNVTVLLDPNRRHPRGDLHYLHMSLYPFDVDSEVSEEYRQIEGKVRSHARAVMTLVRLDAAKFTVNLSAQFEMPASLLHCDD